MTWAAYNGMSFAPVGTIEATRAEDALDLAELLYGDGVLLEPTIARTPREFLADAQEFANEQVAFAGRKPR